jgi:hypothetical protein
MGLHEAVGNGKLDSAHGKVGSGRSEGLSRKTALDEGQRSSRNARPHLRVNNCANAFSLFKRGLVGLFHHVSAK